MVSYNFVKWVTTSVFAPDSLAAFRLESILNKSVTSFLKECGFPTSSFLSSPPPPPFEARHCLTFLNLTDSLSLPSHQTALLAQFSPLLMALMCQDSSELPGSLKVLDRVKIHIDKKAVSSQQI